MRNKNNFFILICFTSLACLSCVSPKGIISNGDLCGFIVDENNNPVPNFIISCSNKSLFKETGLTNSNGFFLFSNVKTGKYYIKGEKENYGIIEEHQFNFNDNYSMFCCQVSSINEVLDNVYSLVNIGEFQKGVDLLNKVTVSKNELSYYVILVYKAYLYKKLSNNKNYSECIKKLKKSDNKKILDFVNLMENENYER